MNIFDADLINVDNGTRIDVKAYAPTLGWTDVSLSIVQYVTAPQDCIQDVILNGTPPGGYALQAIQPYDLSGTIPEYDWLQGVRIKNETDTILTTLRTPVKEKPPIGIDMISVGNAGLKEDKLLLDTHYSGGCATHFFQLNWNGDIIKSNPPQIVLDLSHDANGDTCKSLVTERLQFDLSTILESPEIYTIIVKTDTTETIAYRPR